MKKLALAVVLSASVMAGAALAQNQAAGGFVGPDVSSVVTVEQVKNLRDDTYVTLQGNIIQSIGDEKYTFKDKTGTITVEIDNEDWNGATVSPEDMVEIKGEVDKGWTKLEIEVDSVKKVK